MPARRVRVKQIVDAKPKCGLYRNIRDQNKSSEERKNASVERQRETENRERETYLPPSLELVFLFAFCALSCTLLTFVEEKEIDI